MDPRLWHAAYGPGVPKEIEYREETLWQLFEGSVARFPDAPALLFLNARLTFREVKEDAERLATAMAGLGVGKDDKVAIHLPNLPQTVIAFLATQRLGAQAVMTNPLYTAPEIAHQWNDAGCRLAVTADFLYEQRLRTLRGSLAVEHYIVASIPEYLRFPLRQLAPLKLRKSQPPHIARVAPGPGVHFFRPLIRATTPQELPPGAAFDDVALLQYTGGTTGVSKGAMLTQKNLSVNVQQLRAWFPDYRDGDEVLLGALPFFHIFGITCVMAFAMSTGAAIVLMPNPRDIPQLIKNVAKCRVTLMSAVPAMFAAINQFPDIGKYDLTSIRNCFSGSAPLPLAVMEEFERRAGATIVEGFGLTESAPVSHVNPLGGVRKAGSVGIPFPDTDCRIVDAERGTRELPPGEEGELILRGPQVMKGYWKRPDETAKVLRDGWLYTGDLAAMDEEGYFTIVGRKKDMILASGYNVYPDEVDQVLMQHGAVQEACTIGIPDPRRGETVKSFVVLQPGAEVSEAALIEHCRASLAPYKVPRIIEFRRELPRSSMLKLLRRVLRDEELRKLAGDSAEWERA